MRHLLAIATALAAASPLAAQSSEYFLYGGTPSTTDWEIRRSVDLDNDGYYLTPGESWRFAYDAATLVTFVNDIRYERYRGVPSIFGPGGNDVILRMVDLDQDGVAMSPGEVIVWADTRAAYGVANTSPDGVDFHPTNSTLFVTDDNWNNGPQPGSGITGYRDFNNDGDALDPGESFQLVNGQGTVQVQGTSGPVTIGVTDFEAIMVDSSGTVIAFEQQDLVLYAFTDLNGDRDAMDPGEAWNFLNLVGDMPGLDVNADVLTGALPNPSCPSTGGAGLFASLEGLSVSHGAGPGGKDIYWIVSTATNSSCPSGAGYVFRGIDQNGDGDLNDAGEVTLWLDGASNPYMFWTVTSIWDGYGHDQGVSIWQGNGPIGTTYQQDTVYYLTDLNGDGDAQDSGEQILLYQWDPDGCYAVSLAAAPEGEFWVPPQPSFTRFGSAGMNSQGRQPRIDHIGLPGLGQTFQITLSDHIAGNVAVCILGFSDQVWNRPPLFNLPLDLTPFGMPFNTLYVSVDQQFQTRCNGAGAAAVTFNVPNDPLLDGREIFFQWYCSDRPLNPRGACMSDALAGVIH